MANPDGCLVETEPLAALLRRFLDTWNRDRPQTAGRFASGGAIEVGPLRAAEWLAGAAGVPEATIQNVIDRRYRMTELRIADRLLTALERPELFWDGTLTIYPNPSAPARSRAECCGGSEPTLPGADERAAPGALQPLRDRDDVARVAVRGRA